MFRISASRPVPLLNLTLTVSALMLLPAVTHTTEVEEHSPNRGEVLVVEPRSIGGDFVLTGNSGPVALEDLRGKAVLMTFAYTSCPDVCPTVLAFMGQALDGLNEQELQELQALFITLDPDRDTIDVLTEYAHYFHDSILGLTGTEKQIAGVARLYGVRYYHVEVNGLPPGYAVNHSPATYLLDQDGTLRFAFPQGTPPSVLLDALRHVLAGN